MMKFLLPCVMLLIPAIQCIDDGLALPSVTATEAKASVQSSHFDLEDKKSLGLSPNELKIFSGYALNLLRSKCSSLNFKNIFDIQKYISKRISHFNPKKVEKTTNFQGLIDSIKQCAAVKNQKVSPTIQTKNSQMFGPTLYEQFFGKDGEKDGKIAADDSTDESHIHMVLLPSSSSHRDLIDGRIPTDESRVPDDMDLVKTDNPAPEDTETVPTPTTTQNPKPKASNHKSTTKAISDWFTDVWHSIDSFINRTFNFSFLRKRRSTVQEDGEDSSIIIIYPQFEPTQSLVTDPTLISSTVEPTKPKISGKQLFTSLFDEACQIYCQCENDVTLDFKEAAKELLQFLLTDEKGMDLAGEHYVGQDLIDQLDSCVNEKRRHFHY